jgi:hypothetical protein
MICPGSRPKVFAEWGCGRPPAGRPGGRTSGMGGARAGLGHPRSGPAALRPAGRGERQDRAARRRCLSGICIRRGTSRRRTLPAWRRRGDGGRKSCTDLPRRRSMRPRSRPWSTWPATCSPKARRRGRPRGTRKGARGFLVPYGGQSTWYSAYNVRGYMFSALPSFAVGKIRQIGSASTSSSSCRGTGFLPKRSSG